MMTIMKGEEKVRTAFERNAKALSLRPTLGQGTAVTHVRLKEGLTCEVEDGKWKLTVDMGEKSGGEDRGPNPGVLGRATLGTCLAIGYTMWAAKLNIPIESLEIEVQADYDSRGYHGIDNVTPGYKQIRYIVAIESPAPESEIIRFLDMADSCSDFLHVFAKPQDVVREVRIREPRR
jgi:uncharacterized OsmC-like protein